jgi:hypothetical protein
VSTKTVFAASDVNCLINTLYDVVLVTVQDVEVQVSSPAATASVRSSSTASLAAEGIVSADLVLLLSPETCSRSC